MSAERLPGARKKARQGAALALAAGLVLAAGGAAARAAACPSPMERAALEMRVMQSELMVAALTCGARESYNAFVIKFEPDLVRHGVALRTFFKRAHGSRASAELNRFVTRLANQASQRSVADRAGYCAAASRVFEQVLKLKRFELIGYADRQQMINGLPGVPACATAGTIRPAGGN